MGGAGVRTAYPSAAEGKLFLSFETGLLGYLAGVGWVLKEVSAGCLHLQEGFDQDGGRVGFPAGREELADDFLGVGSDSEALAVV